MSGTQDVMICINAQGGPQCSRAVMDYADGGARELWTFTFGGNDIRHECACGQVMGSIDDVIAKART